MHIYVDGNARIPAWKFIYRHTHIHILTHMILIYMQAGIPCPKPLLLRLHLLLMEFIGKNGKVCETC